VIWTVESWLISGEKKPDQIKREETGGLYRRHYSSIPRQSPKYHRRTSAGKPRLTQQNMDYINIELKEIPLDVFGVVLDRTGAG